MLPLMVEKLATGGRDVQNHFRGELADGDARVVGLIDDFIHRYSGSRTGTSMIGNALGVLGLCADPSAVVVVRKMLGHPAESVRSAAIRAMAKQARPDDYEDLKSLLPTVGGELRRVLVQSMGKSDPDRLAVDLDRWVIDGGEAALSVLAARVVAANGAGDALSSDLLGYDAAADPNLSPFLAAALAGSGDIAAYDILISDLVSSDLLVRTRAIEAVAMSGLSELLLGVVSSDASADLRVLAAEGVSQLLPTSSSSADAPVRDVVSSARIALRAGLRDEASLVRQACMRALIADGDEETLEVFIAKLQGDVSDLAPIFRAVRGSWVKNPGLADRAGMVLLEKLEGMSSRTLSEREPWLQALGQVPSEIGAEWLLALAQSAEGELHNMPARRWILMQMSNGGALGRAPLARAFNEEESIELRLDYLWAASLSSEDDTRTLLLGVVLGDESHDHERLFAADRLTKMGPTPLVAPVLKRACLRIEDRLVRPAFESLLWTWYG